MNTYKPYRNPGFMDGQPGPPAVEFETTEDLLALDDVRRSHKPDSEYVMSDGYLMVLTNDGFEWWVLGKIGNPSEVNLPKWQGAKISVRFPNGREMVAQNGEVSSICGDRIILKGGLEVVRVHKGNK
jgi:hypothetical protein